MASENWGGGRTRAGGRKWFLEGRNDLYVKMLLKDGGSGGGGGKTQNIGKK